MRDIYLTSDTHFFHHNIIKYCNRPFESVEHMNEILIQNWNSVVKQGDIVYHLGDVAMGYQPEEFKKLWPRLNGRKRLIVGNHDDIKFLSSGGFFDKVMMWRVFMDQKLLLTHVPVQEDSIHERIKDANGYNIHGHTHDKGSPISFAGPFYKSVCVELTNYTPVNIEELVND